VISLYGLTREREVLEVVKNRVAGRGQAIRFLTTLTDHVDEYVAIHLADHSKWNEYQPRVRESVRTLNTLQVGPIRPLMLAVAKRFSRAEVLKAFRMFISWVVRFLIVGGARSGSVEEAYANLAVKVNTEEIKTAKQLLAGILAVVPFDEEFRTAFASARVAKNSLARYYLRSLERRVKNESEPEFVPNDDTAINLEHILPESAGKNWGHVPPETAAVLHRRIGNMVLLQASKNSAIGNDKFADKLPVLKASGFSLTREVASNTSWGVDEINKRQARLAVLAVKTWPLAGALK
jgi:hypothetical protein